MIKITDVGAAYDAQFERVEMTDKLRAAAKAALLALKCLDGLECAREEIEALESALAEPTVQESLTGAEQKPMLEMNPEKRDWFGLTEDEIKEIANNCRWSETYHIDFSLAIEAKLREKNS